MKEKWLANEFGLILVFVLAEGTNEGIICFHAERAQPLSQWNLGNIGALDEVIIVIRLSSRWVYLRHYLLTFLLRIIAICATLKLVKVESRCIFPVRQEIATLSDDLIVRFFSF